MAVPNKTSTVVNLEEIKNNLSNLDESTVSRIFNDVIRKRDDNCEIVVIFSEKTQSSCRINRFQWHSRRVNVFCAPQSKIPKEQLNAIVKLHETGCKTANDYTEVVDLMFSIGYWDFETRLHENKEGVVCYEPWRPLYCDELKHFSSCKEIKIYVLGDTTPDFITSVSEDDD